jgi:hypothetical protein
VKGLSYLPPADRQFLVVSAKNPFIGGLIGWRRGAMKNCRLGFASMANVDSVGPGWRAG